MLNRIFGNINSTTSIVTIDGQMFLTNTIIEHGFLNLEKLSAIALRSNVFNFSSKKRDRFYFLLIEETRIFPR